MGSTVIQVSGLSKKYRLWHQQTARYSTLRDTITHYAKQTWKRVRRLEQEGDSNRIENFWALKDVSFDVSQGEVVGVIGRNGAGTSTLLKILSRITEPTEGRITIRGRLASLLEVGTGFHPELTGRENIFLNGSILGMARTEIKRKFDEIVAFAEIERFLDTPVKRYSSGMYVRLAFAVAAHLEPEILIIDEVLAVGDSEFQKKCLGKMKNVAGEGRTVLFVSHNMMVVKNLCSRAILFAKGRIEAEGETRGIIDKYLTTTGSQAGRFVTWTEEEAPQTQEIRLETVEIADDNGQTTSTLSTSDALNIRIAYELFAPLKHLRVTVGVDSPDGIEIFYSTDYHSWPDAGIRPRGRYVSACRVPGFFFNLGMYRLCVQVDIPMERELVPPIYIDFTMDELSYNQMGINLHGRPAGLIHPRMEWEIKQR